MDKKQLIRENVKDIIQSILACIITPLITILVTAAFQTTHPKQNQGLIQENLKLAKQYHQLKVKHQNLNRQYLETHGYQESATTTNGILFIVPYGSNATTKIGIHTPAMVKLEYQQKPIKKQFEHNNYTLNQHNAQTVDLQTQTVNPKDNTPHIIERILWTLASLITITCIIIIIINIKAIIKAKKQINP